MRYGQSNMETYIIICKIDSQWDFARLRELKHGLCINLEGWGGEGVWREFKTDGTYLYLQLIHVMLDRKQQNSIKQLSFD